MGYTKKSNKTKTWAAKREQELKYKKRLKSLSNLSYYTGAILVESDRQRTVKKPYYKRVYLSSGRKGRTNFFKKIASRKTRRYKGEISDGCNYKKIYDYWWEVV